MKGSYFHRERKGRKTEREKERESNNGRERERGTEKEEERGINDILLVS